MIVKTIVLMAAYILPFIWILFGQVSVAMSLLAWFIMGIALAGIGMSVMHDANHGAYSSSPTVNRIVGYSLMLLGGSVDNWKYQHNVLHHTYTNITGVDDDIDSKLLLKFSPHIAAKPVHRWQWIYAFVFYSILTLYWGLLKDLVQYFRFKKIGLNNASDKANRLWLLKITIHKALYFFTCLVLPVLLTDLSIGVVIGGFLIMHAVAGLILSVVFQLAHTVEETEFPMPDDKGMLEASWAVHQLQTTANFSRKNKWLSWYVGGLNFQVEHHLFPGICHVHYPAISDIVQQTAAEYGIQYRENRSFFSALRSHIRLLKQTGIPQLSEMPG